MKHDFNITHVLELTPEDYAKVKKILMTLPPIPCDKSQVKDYMDSFYKQLSPILSYEISDRLKAINKTGGMVKVVVNAHQIKPVIYRNM